MKCFHSLTQGIRHFADVIIPQQPPPFGPELGQLGIQSGQLGGTGVRVQQAAGAEFTDLIVLFGSLGDGPVDLQHGWILPLHSGFQSLHLVKSGPQDDALMEPQLVVHPNKGRVDISLPDRQVWAGALPIPIAVFVA